MEIITFGLPNERIRDERGHKFYYCRPAPGWAAMYHIDYCGGCYRVVIFKCHKKSSPWRVADTRRNDTDIVYEDVDSLLLVLGLIKHHQALLGG